MPNWCNSKLTVIGAPDRVDAFVKKANGPHQHYKPHRLDPPDKKTRSSPLSFHQLVPIPDEVMAKDYDPHGYDAEHTLWGVKWGSSNDRLVSQAPGRADYQYDTPWGPAGTFFDALSEGEWSDLTFIVSWKEEYPSRGRFAVRDGDAFVNVDERPDEIEPPKELDENAQSEWWDSWASYYYDRHDAFVNETRPS